LEEHSVGKRLYKYFPLVSAKLVGRRHPRDIELPSMKELENAFVSRSDGAITARPDFNMISENITAISNDITFAESDDSSDYLNSAFGIYGSDSLVWLSRFIPLSGSSVIACGTYEEGTASVSINSSDVTGSGTEWFKKVWSGCLIEFDDNGDYYLIKSVNTNTSITLTANVDVAHSGVSYKIYKNHQPRHADYKINLQPFTSGMIYSCPTLSVPVNEQYICGPFYASTTSTSTDESWERFEDDSAIGVTSAAFNHGMSMAQGDGILWGMYRETNGMRNFVTTEPYTDWTPQLSFGTLGYNANAGWMAYGGSSSIASGSICSRSIYACGENISGNGSIIFLNDSSDPLSTAQGASNTTGEGFRSIAISDDGVIICTSYDNRYYIYYTVYGSVFNQVSPESDSWGNPVDLGFWSTVFYVNGQFLLFTFQGMYTSSDGLTWTNTGKLNYYNTLGCLAYGDGTYAGIRISSGGSYPSGDIVTFDNTYDSSYSHAHISGITDYYSITYRNGKFYVTCKGTIDGSFGYFIYSSPDLLTWTQEYKLDGSPLGVMDGISFCTTTNQVVAKIQSGSLTHPEFVVSNVETTTTSFHSAEFAPVSDIYRSVTHSVLDGYVVLIGTREYDDTTKQWRYYPRRIRWSTPLTYNDFSSIGSGAADLDGSGSLLDSRAVNGRIVIFESSAIGSLAPRGYASDPWEYDKIKDNIRTISNPVVVDDVCYFIDDSGLLRATNGITVEAPPFSFDLTEYDDFNSDTPIWLTYSPELESLAIYNPSGSGRHVYLIEPEAGTVSRLKIAQLNSEGPKSVVCVENSSDRRLMISFDVDDSGDGDTTKLAVAQLSTGSTITGIDEWTANAGDDTYHNVDLQSPEVYIAPEGSKTGMKHIIARSYTDGTDTDTNPILVVQCKSLEDTAWHDNGDSNGTITVTDSVCTGSGTAWSNIIGAFGGTVYTTPCLATQARIYVGSSAKTLGTDYTITGTKQITFGSVTGDTVYAYWENQPEIVVEVGDFIQTTEGWHRITAVNSATSLTLDHYMSSGQTDATATHHHGTVFPVGDGEVKIGISKLVEGVKLRFLIFHRPDGDATVTKLTGFSVGHIPAGEKIVEP